MIVSSGIVVYVLVSSLMAQTIKQLNEIVIDEELPLGSIVTFLTDKIPHLDQSLEYDLVTPVSNDLDLFTIDHTRHALIVSKRLDYEQLCLQGPQHRCQLSISIAVSNRDTINVYTLPIQLKNIDDHPMLFPINRTVIEIEENDDNWPNQVYALPRAFDADMDTISYSIYLQNWHQPDELFHFDSSKHQLKPMKSFDREQQQVYVLRFVAHNAHQHDISMDVIVVIQDRNDHAPVCERTRDIFVIDHREKQSTYILNVTDLDQGDNSKLEYILMESMAGFELDRFNGHIRFDAATWSRTNRSKLIVNITDHGQPTRLSCQCIVELEFQSLFNIDFHGYSKQYNKSHRIIPIEDIHRPLGQWRAYDEQMKQLCLQCSFDLTLSLPELVDYNSNTSEIYLNVQSMVIQRILTSSITEHEYLPLTIDVHVWQTNNPSLQTRVNRTFVLRFHKATIIEHSQMIFMNINDDWPLHTDIAIDRTAHSCLRMPLIHCRLIDTTRTFTFDDNQTNIILRKQLNIHRQQYYELTWQYQHEVNRMNNGTCHFIHLLCRIYSR
jgi:hypothetical protein